MPTTSPKTGGGPLCSTAPDYWIGRKADDIPPGWVDDMIWRLFTEWNRTMLRYEKRKADDRDYDPKPHEADTRTFTRLQRSLAELIRLEMARQALRATKATDNDEDPRKAFERRMGRLLEHQGIREIPGEPVE